MKSVYIKDVKDYDRVAFVVCDYNVKDKVYTLGYMAGCRAYAADELFTYKNINKTTRKISGYLPKDYNWKTGNTYVLVSVPNIYIKAFLANLGFLHSKEEKAGVAKSEVFKVNGTTNTYLVKGSGHWKNKCWSQLLYTFYIKCMCVENPTALNLNGEEYYWTALRRHDSNGITNEDKLLKAVKMRKEIFSVEVFGNKLNTGVHDREGFVSICDGKNPPMEKLLNIHTGKPADWFKKNVTVINW